MKKIILHLLLLCITLASAQSKKETFSIWGRIVDHGFCPIELFTIKIFKYTPFNKEKKLIQDFKVKDDNGEFLIKRLHSETYLIEITVENYTRYSIIKTIYNKNESVGEVFLQNSW